MSQPDRRSHFLTDIIDADLASGKHGGKVATRFPPEPNGYLHIGHAKSIVLNFGLAQQYGGTCNLRMDDTNPVTEDTDYVESIQRDVAWLGGRWSGEVRYASDYFGRMYELAEGLVRAGKAYVDDQSVDEIRKGRGDFTTAGVASPFRDRSPDENLDLLRRMKAGEFADGAKVLRAKIDMAHPNVLMRDPLIYRIRHAHHHRSGDTWCIYPMYDYAHPLEDAIEGITHSICTLEFETNRELYDWFLDHTGPLQAGGQWSPRPRQYEFARLALGYTVMSKRKLLQLVQEGRVSGWDDPRMPTIAGMRRRGVTPEALRDFAELIGVAKHNSMVDIGKLEFCIRQDLEQRSPRALAVLKPLAVTLTNFPADMIQQLEIPWWPGDRTKGTRKVPFSKHLFIEQDDFSADPPADWKRLAVGREVRLVGAYFMRCDGFDRDPQTGAVTGLRCSVDLHTKGGEAADGRQPAATLHWVDARQSVEAEVRLYDRLFRVEQPDADGDFVQHLNPDSLQVVRGRLEPALQETTAARSYQFMRLGYFCADGVEAGVWNRTIGLRDTWARDKEAAKPAAQRPAAAPVHATPKAADVDAALAAAVAADPALAGLAAQWKVDPAQLGRLAQHPERLAFWQASLATAADGPASLRWLLNDLAGLLGTRGPSSLPGTAAQFGTLVALVQGGQLTAAAGKTLLARWVEAGGDPAVLADREGLRRDQAGNRVAEAVEAVLQGHAAEVQRYRSGETKLLAVLLGAAMRNLKGADPQAVRSALEAKLQPPA